MIPNIAIVHFENPHWRRIRLWVPLFLLWIPVILLSPFIFLVLVGVCIVVTFTASSVPYRMASRTFLGSSWKGVSRLNLKCLARASKRLRFQAASGL